MIRNTASSSEVLDERPNNRSHFQEISIPYQGLVIEEVIGQGRYNTVNLYVITIIFVQVPLEGFSKDNAGLKMTTTK